MTALTPTWLVLNQVRDEQAEDFETLVRDRIAPAAESVGLPGPWQVHRAGSSDGLTTFVFLFEGGRIEDWDIARTFAPAVGADEAQAIDRRMEELLVREQEVLPLTCLY